MTRLIVAGSRHFNDFVLLKDTVDAFIQEHNLTDVEIVSGGARGADELGEIYAKIRGYPVKVFKADWEHFGKSAGPMRNRQMAEYATHCVVFPNVNTSVGSWDMVEYAVAYDLVLKVMKWQG